MRADGPWAAKGADLLAFLAIALGSGAFPAAVMAAGQSMPSLRALVLALAAGASIGAALGTAVRTRGTLAACYAACAAATAASAWLPGARIGLLGAASVAFHAGGIGHARFLPLITTTAVRVRAACVTTAARAAGVAAAATVIPGTLLLALACVAATFLRAAPDARAGDPAGARVVDGAEASRWPLLGFLHDGAWIAACLLARALRE